MAVKKARTTGKRKITKKMSSGILYVRTTSNNTLITLTDDDGNKILGGGAGLLGYKGAKKNTPYAAEVLTKDLLKTAQGFGLKTLGIVIQGTGMARDGVFKAVNEIGVIDIQYIKEATPIQFGGCKGKRPKRN